MKQVCKFRKGADIMETVQGLQTSIPDAIDYYRIKDTSCPSSYNNQKDLSDVGSRVKEPFDVIEYDRSFTRLRKYMKDEISMEKLHDKTK